MKYEVISTNELYHHGVKGQKWGVRKYQNKDGSLTAAGKKRRNRYEKAADAAERDADDLRKHGYIKEAEAVQRVADKNRLKSKTTNKHKDYTEAHSKKKINELSDAELRKRLTRLNMEQQYNTITKNNKKAKKFVDKVAKKTATLAALTSSSLLLYNNIDKIKKILGTKIVN